MKVTQKESIANRLKKMFLDNSLPVLSPQIFRTGVQTGTPIVNLVAPP